MNRAARAAAAHSHTDAGPDQIVCLICGETYRAITYLHLRRIHGFEGPHPVWDYKERFGLRVAVCEEVCEHSRKVSIARHKKAGRHWTRTRLLREIRRRRGTRGALAYSRVPDALSLAARRMYGSWDEALRRAGVDPALHRMTRAWDRKRLVAEIRRHAATGERITSSWVKEVDPELHRAAIRLVGNWTEATRAAGLDPREHREPKKWCMEHVTAWVRETHAAGGDLRSIAAPAGAQARVTKEAGCTWSEFVESLGIQYPGRKKRLDWTRAAVLAEIRKLRRRGLPLNDRAVKRQCPGLVQQGRQRFGSWDAALRAAGLDPKRIRLKRRWTRADVLAAIRARKKARKSLRSRDAVADDPRLVKAARRRFPGGWAGALAAAGVARPRGRVTS